MDTHEEISTLKNHTENIDGLTFYENKYYHHSGNTELYSTDLDGIQIWNVNRNQIRRKMYIDCAKTEEDELEAAMLSFKIYKNKLFIGYYFGRIRVLDIYTYKHIITLKGHGDGSCCLVIQENKIYSGGDSNGAIHVWNTDTYEHIRTLHEHTTYVLCLIIHENKLYSGSADNTICIWNTETYEKVATFRGHTEPVICLTHHENKLYSGSYDKTIRIWNTDTHEHIRTLEGHTNAVRCFTLYENKLVSGSEDNTIRVWKV
jgi:F-box/WD-40 domain protein 7